MRCVRCASWVNCVSSPPARRWYRAKQSTTPAPAIERHLRISRKASAIGRIDAIFFIAVRAAVGVWVAWFLTFSGMDVWWTWHLLLAEQTAIKRNQAWCAQDGGRGQTKKKQRGRWSLMIIQALDSGAYIAKKRANRNSSYGWRRAASSFFLGMIM